MARIALQKIRVLGLKHHEKLLLQELHKRGGIEISHNKDFDAFPFSDEAIRSELFTAFDVARIDFALRFLEPFAPKKPKLENMLTGGKLIMPEKQAVSAFESIESDIPGIVERCEILEELFIKNKNEIQTLEAKKEALDEFLAYPFLIGEGIETSETKTILVKTSPDKAKELLLRLAKKSSLFDIEDVYQSKQTQIFRITVLKSFAPDLQEVLQALGVEVLSLSLLFPGHEEETPLQAKEAIEASIEALQKEVESGKEEQIALAKRIDDLKLAYDFFSWKKQKNDASKKSLKTKNLFIFDGWMPEKEFNAFSHWIKQVFIGEVSVEKIPVKKGEKVPALLKNAPGASSFQMITEMFGPPKTEDVDPTAIMTPFFIVFFGICLSDVGYGLILALISGFFLAFGKFSKEAREKMLMIFLCGVSAILGGVLLGGWFGMTPEQFPLLANPETGNFYGQILNPLAGNGAMTFLLFSFGIGFFQLLVGVFMDGVKRWKNGEIVSAFADSFAWLYFLIGLALWALADQLGLPKETLQYVALSGAGILVLTQGRDKKNPIAKLVFGLLGLYSIMDYVSNMLSYSRLMALGLATGIIGAAMNTTAGVLGELVSVPVLGTVIAVFFVLFGHSLNFALSLLGAFIHSMRLQFIEFFGRFYAGGAPLFAPFARAKKYLFLKG